MVFLRYGFGVGAFAAVALSVGTALAAPFDSENLMTDRKLSSFESVYIAPVETNLDLDVLRRDRNGTRDRPVSAEDAARKAADFHDELVGKFGESFSLASAPGPGVLTLQATLTNLESTLPTVDDYDRNSNLSFRSVSAGGAAMTTVFSEDGAPLAEVSDNFDSSLTDGVVRSATWHDADRAFYRWARKLAKFAKEN